MLSFDQLREANSARQACITPTGNSFIRKMSADELAFRDLVHRRAQEAAGV